MKQIGGCDIGYADLLLPSAALEKDKKGLVTILVDEARAAK